MSAALEEARKAGTEHEVPVGAVLVHNGSILARDHNRMVQQKDPLAHAELLTLQSALQSHTEKWLLDSTLFVTLEPCAMCAGALVLARVKRLVYATADPKAGACGSVLDIVRSPHLNHRLQVDAGVCRHESAALLSGFFRNLRKKIK
jgi:tRNA(adenine34) deaminase